MIAQHYIIYHRCSKLMKYIPPCPPKIARLCKEICHTWSIWVSHLLNNSRLGFDRDASQRQRFVVLSHFEHRVWFGEG